jgi:hypothetical protein
MLNPKEALPQGVIAMQSREACMDGFNKVIINRFRNIIWKESGGTG